jgi:hypothetical protein
MNINSILQICDMAGISFLINDKKLIVKGSEKAITEHLSLLREHKESIRLHLIEPKKDDLIYFFEERAAIYEFEANNSREEAEAIAYQDCINEWIFKNPPFNYQISNCVHCEHKFDFSVGGYLAWGDVYCCHFGDNHDHLQPYIKSRTKEAEASLKLLNIKKNC